MVYESGNFLPYDILNAPGATDFDVFWRDIIDRTCAIHTRLPAMFQPIVPSPTGIAGNPLGPLIADQWDRICQRPAPPEVPGSAYASGCENTVYRVEGEYTFFGEQKTFGQDFNGQVVGAFWQPIPEGQVAGINNIVVRFCGGQTSVFGAPDATSPPNFQRRRITIVPLTPEGGSCCPEIPPNPQFNVLPDSFIIPIGGNDVEVPIQWPGVELDIDNNVIGFEPVIRTPLGEISFELGGLSWNPRVTISPDINIPIGRPNSGGGGATPSEVTTIVDNSAEQTVNQITQFISETVDLTPILEAINALAFEFDAAELLEIVRCYIERGLGEVETQVLASGSSGGTFDLPPNTLAVTFEATLPFTNQTRNQQGSGSAEQVWYWGWLAVGGEPGFNGGREPLFYENQVKNVPRGAANVTFNPVFQNTGRVTAIVQADACPTPEEFIVPVPQQPMAGE